MLQDGMLAMASSTALSFSAPVMEEFLANLDFYRERIVLRPQEISNHPEVIRRIGIILAACRTQEFKNLTDLELA